MSNLSAELKCVNQGWTRFESAHEFLINLNFVFFFRVNECEFEFCFFKINEFELKYLNLIIFSKSMNLNIVIKRSTNLDFFDLKLREQK